MVCINCLTHFVGVFCFSSVHSYAFVLHLAKSKLEKNSKFKPLQIHKTYSNQQNQIIALAIKIIGWTHYKIYYLCCKCYLDLIFIDTILSIQIVNTKKDKASCLISNLFIFIMPWLTAITVYTFECEDFILIP